jgi:hypothetical protein
MRLTGIDYVYKSDKLDILKENGVVCLLDFHLRFANNGQK